MKSALDESYGYCQRIARERARNFYYSFVLLPKERKKAMCAIYAFMRYCDDLSDDPNLASEAAIERWSAELQAALKGNFSGHPVWPAFHDTVQTYKIPHRYFYDMIEGVRSDLAPREIATFDDLYRYCYQVASVVGLTVIHIFGFESTEALSLAEKCGVAFQLTNILRDIKEDVERDRIYLPREDLVRFDVKEQDLRATQHTPEFSRMMEFQARRAQNYYNASKPLIGMVDPSSRSSLRALIEIYRQLLERIERSGYDVLRQRISLPAWRKAAIVLRALL